MNTGISSLEMVTERRDYKNRSQREEEKRMLEKQQEVARKNKRK